MIIICPYCKKKADVRTGAVNRAKKLGVPRYCTKKCSALARSFFRTPEEKKRIKQEYDKLHRKVFSDEIKAKKAIAFKLDYAKNPEKYRKQRQARKEEHNEYCRQPEYRKWKAQYDKQYHAKKNFGEFWESALIVNKIEEIIDDREVRQINNLHNKSQKRKRQWKTKQNYLQRT